MPEHGNEPTEKNGRLESTGEKPELYAAEIEPCLIQNDSQPEKLSFYEKYLSDFQANTGLTRKWIFVVLTLVILVAVLFLVVVGLVIGWPVLPHMFRYPLCREPQCLRAASQIRENLDVSTSPCSNLWGAVCSSYVNNSARPLDLPIWNQKEMLIQKELERIRTMISTLELPLHTGTIDWKLKNFYEACVNIDNVALDLSRPLMNIISELGGWHILRDWNQVEFDGMKVLKILHVQYGVNPFFKVHVEPDPHVPETYSIRISPAGLGLPDKNYYYRDDQILTAYMDYIRDVVISLSSTRNEAAKFGRDIFNYEKRIAEITPDWSSLQNPITTYNAISLAELKLTTSTIPFYDLLQAMYPKVSISENTEVIVTSLEYLSELTQIISSTDRQTMNGYLIWCLVREYLPFLSESYTSAIDSFNKELFGVSKSDKRWEVCSKWVRKFMSLATEYHLETAFPIAEKTRKMLNDTFRTILTVIRKKVGNFGHSSLLQDHLASKLNTLSLQIGLPDSARNMSYLKEYYNPLIIFKMNLFESIKSAIPLKRKVDERFLLNQLPQGAFLNAILNDLPKVSYIPSRNAIVIPRALAMEPFTEDGYPRPVIYGRLGTEIAFAILSAILPYGSMWRSDKKILSPFHMTVEESFKSVATNLHCLSTYLTRNSGPIFALNDVSLSAFKEMFAAKVTNEALLDAVQNDDHVHYSGLEQYEESALYFLTYAQTQCSESTKQYQLYRNSLYFTLQSKDLLELAWSHLAEFRRAFDCSSSEWAKCFDVVPK